MAAWPVLLAVSKYTFAKSQWGAWLVACGRIEVRPANQPYRFRFHHMFRGGFSHVSQNPRDPSTSSGQAMGHPNPSPSWTGTLKHSDAERVCLRILRRTTRAGFDSTTCFVAASPTSRKTRETWGTRTRHPAPELGSTIDDLNSSYGAGVLQDQGIGGHEGDAFDRRLCD
jgi:hypothetical protein